MAITTYNSTLREWENIIRVNLKVTNPALLKSGALGILTNYLAGIKFDNIQYYSKIFQEMNVGLAQDFNSMLYHSTIYGAELSMARAPTLTSSLILPELKIAGVNKLKYNIPKNTSFTDSNGLNYIFEQEVNVEMTSGTIRATAWDKNVGSQKLSITRAANPNVADSFLYLIHNNVIEQYTREFQSVKTTGYEYSENFNFNTGITNIDQIKHINVWVNTGDELNLQYLDSIDSEDIVDITEPGKTFNIVKYDVKYHKFGSSGQDRHIFAELFETSINFETGDGLHGAIVPGNSQIIVEIQLTQGEKGNIHNSEFMVREISVTEFYNGTNITNQYTTTINGLSTTGSSGGKSIQNIEEIRGDILGNINTRNSIVTETDYQYNFLWDNIKPFVDAKFIDAKAFVFLFNAIHDNDTVVPTTAINFREMDLTNNSFYPTYTYNGINLISPFYYKNKTANTIEAWLLDPEYFISWTKSIDSPETPDSGVYRVEMAITYDFTVRKSYIKILNGEDSNFDYHFNCTQFGADVILNEANNFSMPIDDIYTDIYCILEQPLTNLTLVVEQEGIIVAKFDSVGPHHPLSLKQTFYKYFKEVENVVNQPPVQTPNNFAYLDNILSDTISTPVDLAPAYNEEAYLLRLPFISEEYFYKLPADQFFSIIDNYFMVKDKRDIVNYNTQLTQTFYNTIDIPTIYHDYLFERNTNGVLTTPELKIKAKIIIDNEKFLTSKYIDTEELKLEIKIAIIQFLKKMEGFEINYFESVLEKEIWNAFDPLVKNIRVENPTVYIVNSPTMIYEEIRKNLTFDEMLEFVPPYFYYDYNNIDLEIIT